MVNQPFDLLADNPDLPLGRRKRQLMRWRVPGAGFVDMYINPQQLQTRSRKIITRRRTKGGYVVQYWGSDLDVITISGTTGAAGIEGINILKSVYRAEQEAFESVAQTLADRLGAFSLDDIAGGIQAAVSSPAGAGQAISNAIGSMLGSGRNPPLLPTLASLALAVELYYHGKVYKGYFTDFSVTESVQQGVGVFQYSMTFHVTDQRGIRSNFMPWHRSPADTDRATGDRSNYRPADSENTAPSFGGEEE
jgi:hypothetical protein